MIFNICLKCEFFFSKYEKKERESTTESLLKLLEDTCSKIDKNFKN